MKNKMIAAILPNPKSDALIHAEGGGASPKKNLAASPTAQPCAYEVCPTIFKKNVKKNSKLRPFNEIISDVGDIQYFPA